MKTIVSATLLGVLAAGAPAAADATGTPAQFDPLTTGEGGNGSGSVRLSSSRAGCRTISAGDRR